MKKSIEGWIEAVTGHTGKGSPTLVIIDELDRCRPSYAVEMLEVVKHIFDIPGVFFIISTDTEQLQHAIKVVYGSGFNAQIYLSRFFDARFTLQSAPLESVIQAHCNTMVFEQAYQNEMKIFLWPPCEEHLKNVTAVMDIFEIAPRDSIQIVNRIMSILLHLPKNSALDLIFLTTILCLQKKNYSFYSSIVTSKQLNEISSYHNDNPWFISSSKLSMDVRHAVFENNSQHIEVPFYVYYQNVFAHYLGTFKSLTKIPTFEPFGKADNIIGEIISSVQQSGREAAINEDNSRRWLLYSYSKSNLFMVSKHKYKELVELATSFS
ncbi:KAP family P-loop NTPase fold protein [Aeromonas hydrophila]